MQGQSTFWPVLPLLPFLGLSSSHPPTTLRCSPPAPELRAGTTFEVTNGNWYGQMVQRRQGFRFHSAERQLQGCVRTHQCSRAGGDGYAQRRSVRELRGRQRTRQIGRLEPQDCLTVCVQKKRPEGRFFFGRVSPLS